MNLMKYTGLAVTLAALTVLGACHTGYTSQSTASPQDIAVSRTHQKRIVKMAQSDFVFMSSIEVLKKMGFVVEKTDRDKMTLQAFRVHNNNRIIFHLTVINQGRDTLIKMATQYYDTTAYDYNEPYATYSLMMWDYLGQKLEKVY